MENMLPGVYFYHGETKTIFVKSLHPDARRILSSLFPPPGISGSKVIFDINNMPIETEDGILKYLAQITDPRKKRGIRYSQISVMAIAICAILSGEMYYIAIAESGLCFSS